MGGGWGSGDTRGESCGGLGWTYMGGASVGWVVGVVGIGRCWGLCGVVGVFEGHLGWRGR